MTYHESVKADPVVFLKHCLLGGYQFETNGLNLIVSPARCVDYEMFELLKTHKSALMQILGSHEQREV